MNTQRLAGVALLVIGIVLLVIGLNASHSMVDQISNTFLGRFTQGTMWYIVGGIVLAVFGGVLTMMGGGSRAAK